MVSKCCFLHDVIVNGFQIMIKNWEMDGLNKVWEIKKYLEICNHQWHPDSHQNLVHFAPKSYGFIAARAILAHNMWLNV